MKTEKRYIKYFLTVCLLLLYATFWAQKETDSSLVFATKQVYENPDKAIETALARFNSSGSDTDLKVRALIIVSTAYSSKRQYEKSLEYSLKALDLFPKIKGTSLKINLLNRIGGQYQELKVYDKSINYLDEANTLINILPENDSKYRSIGFNNLVRGFIYREQMSCDIALEYFDKAIEAYKKIFALSIVNANMSTAYYNKGNCLLAMQRRQDAEYSFLQSIEYAKKINAKSLVAFAQKGLAETYTTQGNIDQAITLLTDALKNSEDVGDKILNRAIYDALASNYLKKKDLKNYSLFQNKNLSVHEEIIKTERKTIDNAIQNLMKSNSEKIKEDQNRRNVFLIILSLLLILAAFFLIKTIYSSEKTLKSLKKKLTF